MEDSCKGYDGDDGLNEMFDVLDERGSDEEMFERLDVVWKKLKDVDRMILESYYLEGCKLNEIAKKVGYKNGNTVKSKKDKVLKRMMRMMKEEAGADAPDLPLVA
jgi:DNA-directed RNA polymerase specialized sigma24 family protein